MSFTLSHLPMCHYKDWNCLKAIKKFGNIVEIITFVKIHAIHGKKVV